MQRFTALRGELSLKEVRKFVLHLREYILRRLSNDFDVVTETNAEDAFNASELTSRPCFKR